AILHSVFIVAHTQKHGSRLEKQRMNNIDFIPELFKFGNIRERLFMQLCVWCFNIQWQYIFMELELLGCTLSPFFSYKNDFDNTNIHKNILTFITNGYFINSPNIVILEAGGEPNDDEGIFESYQIKIEEYLDVASDELIFRRILDYKRDINPYTRNLLEKIWTLALEILNLFENPNQTMHKLLQFLPELNSNGYNILFTAYEKGKLRMEALLKQEVYDSRTISTKSKAMSSTLNPTPIFELTKCSVDNSVPDSSSQNNHDNGKGSLRKRKCNFTQSDKFTEEKARRVTKDNEKKYIGCFCYEVFKFNTYEF
ncbi:21669_t:CDS:2, partial [Gigaspora margarita]